MLGFKASDFAKEKSEKLDRNKRIGVFIGTLVLYIILLLFFYRDNYIYTTGLSVIGAEKGFTAQLGINLYRSLVALVGCIMILVGSTLITKKFNWVATISSKSMIIYIVTASIFTYIPQLMTRAGVRVLLGSIPAVVTDIVLLIPISVVLILLSLLAEKIIEKIKLGKVLLGK